MTAQWPRPLVRARIGLVNIEQSTWRGSRQNAQDNLSGGKFNRVLQKHSVPEATDYDLWVWTHQIQDEESFPGSIFSEGWKCENQRFGLISKTGIQGKLPLQRRVHLQGFTCWKLCKLTTLQEMLLFCQDKKTCGENHDYWGDALVRLQSLLALLKKFVLSLL